MTVPIGLMAETPFDKALSTLLNSNQTMKSARLRSAASLLDVKAENQLDGPEVEFSRVWGSNRAAGNKWELSVSQSFDWPGVYAARREAFIRAETASQFITESEMIETRAEARQLLLDAIHLEQVLEMQTTLAHRVDSLEQYFRLAAEEGIETRLDYNKTVIERISVHRELHTLQSQWGELMSSIEAFGGGLDAEALVRTLGGEYPPVATIPMAPTREMLKQRDPAYAAAVAQSEAARSMMKVENRLRLPGFSVGYVHETELGARFDGFSIGVALPSWGRNHKSKAALLEAEASLMDAEIELVKTHASMNGDVRRLAALKEVIDEYEPVVGSNDQGALLKSALDAGLITYLTYIEESNYLIAARRDYLDTLWEYHSIVGRLARYD
ncbi:MAG: TolC family protein [Muribaculaceae bacterium]|nr:TolC family protein [Muribaculaceae bacterium]